MPDNPLAPLAALVASPESGNHPKAEEGSPNEYFRRKYPKVAKNRGHAFQMKYGSGGRKTVAAVSEDFLAEAIGPAGTPQAPTVFLPSEERFYQYSPGDGIYLEVSDHTLGAQLSEIIREAALNTDPMTDVSNLQYGLCSSSQTRQILQRARGLLAVKSFFKDGAAPELIPCKNGVLNLDSGELNPFSPEQGFRHKLDVPYEPSAVCPTFMRVLESSMAKEDINLFQRWCGLALTGANHSQALMILVGTSGGGKGTCVRVLKGILGSSQMATLRPKQLTSRFEIGRFVGRTLLYGPDVGPDFFNCDGAAVIKSLTGGDPMTVEMKNSNERPELKCSFNVIVTANARLSVKIEGDQDAWRRRLRIIHFTGPPPTAPIHNLSELILAREGSGVLNWMLQGLVQLKQADWQLEQTAAQKSAVDDMLSESTSDLLFVKDVLYTEAQKSLTHRDCYSQYQNYCSGKHWNGLSQKAFGSRIDTLVSNIFGVPARNDIRDHQGRQQRGWKGIACKS
ncbi:MAG: hypothetical protein JWM16_5651 [Verrucomicrobiales bacterium]|nr:hypothetical protein [Verrucomicrobiales bacterium]